MLCKGTDYGKTQQRACATRQSNRAGRGGQDTHLEPEAIAGLPQAGNYIQATPGWLAWALAELRAPNTMLAHCKVPVHMRCRMICWHRLPCAVINGCEIQHRGPQMLLWRPGVHTGPVCIAPGTYPRCGACSLARCLERLSAGISRITATETRIPCGWSQMGIRWRKAPTGIPSIARRQMLTGATRCPPASNTSGPSA